MDKNYYKQVEYDLYNYNMYKIAIENLEKDIEYLLRSDEVRSLGSIAYDQPGGGKTNKIYSIVEDTALSISESILYKEMTIRRLKNKIESIDRALEGLGEREKIIIVEKYIKNRQWYQVGGVVGYGERHCKRIRTTAINKMIIGIYGSKD